MPHYMLLLHDDREGLAKLGPEEMQKVLEKYVAWQHKPFVVDGRRLDDDGRLMRRKKGSVTVTDGPYAETKEVLGGYYTIEAQDFEQAVELSLDHPHVDFGTIEIREVVTPAG